MIQLPNSCQCSDLAISPQNWKQSGASLKKDWFLHYRFYDGTNPKGKQVILKGGINTYHTLAERREVAKLLLNEVYVMLVHDGWNPITKKYFKPNYTEYEIAPSTLFIEALEKVFKKIKFEENTKADIRSVLKYLKIAVNGLRIAHYPISEIKRRHIKMMFEYLSNTRPSFTANTQNKYKAYLSTLYSELVEMEAVEYNIIRDIRKKKVEKKLREVLTLEERKAIDVHLKKNNYSFWRFTNIFFHSGARVKELLKVKKCDVNLTTQKFKVLVKKGRAFTQMERTIKDVALPLWEEIMNKANNDDYLFSVGLEPGLEDINSDQITKRWRLWVKAPKSKKGLGIKADFYSLKHSNLDETSEILSIEAASKAAGHTSVNTTQLYYTINEKERMHNKLKSVNNTFS